MRLISQISRDWLELVESLVGFAIKGEPPAGATDAAVDVNPAVGFAASDAPEVAGTPDVAGDVAEVGDVADWGVELAGPQPTPITASKPARKVASWQRPVFAAATRTWWKIDILSVSRQVGRDRNNR
jgi:hypothetical protein